jgi:hypothetical protein
VDTGWLGAAFYLLIVLTVLIVVLRLRGFI